MVDDDNITKCSEEFPDNDNYVIEREIVERAKEGDVEAAKSILSDIPDLLVSNEFGSPYIKYLIESLNLYKSGVQIERALGVEKEPNKGGRRKAYNDLGLAAVDILLQKFAGKTKEDSIKTISEIFIDNPQGRDMGKKIRTLRKEYKLEEFNKRYLLHMSGIYRQKVGEVLPED